MMIRNTLLVVLLALSLAYAQGSRSRMLLAPGAEAKTPADVKAPQTGDTMLKAFGRLEKGSGDAATDDGDRRRASRLLLAPGAEAKSPKDVKEAVAADSSAKAFSRLETKDAAADADGSDDRRRASRLLLAPGAEAKSPKDVKEAVAADSSAKAFSRLEATDAAADADGSDDRRRH